MSLQTLNVAFSFPAIDEAEIREVVETLRSGWLTTGPRVRRFEDAFAADVGAHYAIAVNSCTAALHLALEAKKLKPADGVLVPTLTFAATAEVVRYLGAFPILVDCDAYTGNMDLIDAENKVAALRAGQLPGIPPDIPVAGMIPVHVGGYMMNITDIQNFARAHNLWVIEDAAHAYPSAWRPSSNASWQRCGEDTADASCFSFYANKTITTGEGGMVTTSNEELAKRMRMMSLHGLSHDAWDRYSKEGSWDYRIVAPGFKYNLTDIAAAIGIHQVAKAERLRMAREQIALEYVDRLSSFEEIQLPVVDGNRIHSWHLFPIRLNLELLKIDRNAFFVELKKRGINCSVHWRPLHMHPYYIETYGWTAEQLPVASREWVRLISIPIFSSMQPDQVDAVVSAITDICNQNRKK